jgi:FkbM family methyltransferase
LVGRYFAKMNTSTSPLVIDIGMFDTADTDYYLATGHRVLAIEASPRLARLASSKLSGAISEGRLDVINAAVAQRRDRVTLTISGDDGCSSVVPGWLDGDAACGSYEVDGITMADVLARAGQRPRLVKIDIEGADGFCVEAITKDNRPEFLSVEAHERCEEFIDRLSAAGFTRFKLIEQKSFRAVENLGNMRDRIANKIVRMAGFAEPRYIRRNGRLFTVGNSSGPAPWESDGRWHTRAEVLALWPIAQAHAERRRSWFDLHAG